MRFLPFVSSYYIWKKWKKKKVEARESDASDLLEVPDT